MSRKVSTRKKKYLSPAEKANAVDMIVNEGFSRKEVAKRYGVGYSTVFKWTKDIKPPPIKSKTKTPQISYEQQIKELKTEVKTWKSIAKMLIDKEEK